MAKTPSESAFLSISTRLEEFFLFKKDLSHTARRQLFERFPRSLH